MSTSVERKLTASQEDYLEAIWSLIWKDGVARVSDIAGRLGVSTPSVSGALKGLVSRKLVEHTPHSYVKLTDRGMELAERVSARHSVLREFLTEVLGLSEELADRNACRIEHAVDEPVSQRLGRFVKFVSQDRRGKGWAKNFKAFCKRQEAAEAKRLALSGGKGGASARGKKGAAMTLADVKPGEKARIVRLGTTASTSRRLAVMGMTRDSVVSVVRIAPLGDPIEVKVRGYSLSLRKGQARRIEVEGA